LFRASIIKEKVDIQEKWKYNFNGRELEFHVSDGLYRLSVYRDLILLSFSGEINGENYIEEVELVRGELTTRVTKYGNKGTKVK